MRYLIALFLIAMISWESAAQDTPDPKTWTEEFLTKLVEDGSLSAHRLLQQSYLAELRPEAVIALRENMRKAEETYGTASGYEFVNKKEIGSSVLLLHYLVKREVQPVFWKFILYRRGSNWNLVSFVIFDELHQIPAFWNE